MTSDAARLALRPGAARLELPDARQAPSTLPVTLLLVSFVIPWLVPVGPLVLSVYRLVLLAMIAPSAIAWLTGKVGRVRVADIAILFFCFWCALGLFVVHDESVALEAGGVQFIETFGAYLVGRCSIRTPRQFVSVIRTAFIIIACLAPFAFVEMVTGVNIGRGIFSAILPTYQPNGAPDMRAGMTRAMVMFEHPILFGLYAACMLALVHMVLGQSSHFLLRWLRSAVICAATFFSLSSAPIGALIMQMALMAWNSALKSFPARWKLLWVLVALLYVGLDLASDQNPIQIYVSRFTFSQESAWYRFLIWDYGTASIMAHPLFGVGFGEWERPSYMTTSFDMFWLILPLRHGLAAGFAVYLAFIAIYLSVALKRFSDPVLVQYRTAYLITLTAFFLTGWSVHLWGVPYVLLMMLLGGGVWFLDQSAEASSEGGEQRAQPKPARRGGVAVAARSGRRIVRGQNRIGADP